MAGSGSLLRVAAPEANWAEAEAVTLGEATVAGSGSLLRVAAPEANSAEGEAVTLGEWAMIAAQHPHDRSRPGG